VRAVEVPQALDVGEERQGDEVQGRDGFEIPLHVWQDEEAKRVRRGWRAEEYLLGFRSTRDDFFYPVRRCLNA